MKYNSYLIFSKVEHTNGTCLSRAPNLARLTVYKCQRVPDRWVPLSMHLHARTRKWNLSVLGPEWVYKDLDTILIR